MKPEWKLVEGLIGADGEKWDAYVAEGVRGDGEPYKYAVDKSLVDLCGEDFLQGEWDDFTRDWPAETMH